jgi:hypothetical protein
MITLIGYNKSNKNYELYLIARLNNESFELYKQLYSILKSNYSFSPKYIKCDFCISNIIAITKEFIDCKIIPCFFHLIQS